MARIVFSRAFLLFSYWLVFLQSSALSPLKAAAIPGVVGFPSLVTEARSEQWARLGKDMEQVFGAEDGHDTSASDWFDDDFGGY